MRLTENINVRVTKAEKRLLEKTCKALYAKKSISWMIRNIIEKHQIGVERMYNPNASDEDIKKQYRETLNEIEKELINK